MEAANRHRPTTRTSRIPARVRTASMPRPVLTKSVDFCETPVEGEQKRIRRKWKSFNLSSPSPPVNAINNNTVDILSEWREELADEQNIHSLLQLSKDLLNHDGPQALGPEETAYRQEQALYWLCKAAERGSKEARDTVTDMFLRGQGVNEANFEAVYACSWQGGLTVSQLMGRRLGRKAFRKLDLGRGFCTSDQINRLMHGKDVIQLDAEDVRNRCLASSKITAEELAEAGAQHMDGRLPCLDKKSLAVYRRRRSKIWLLSEMMSLSSIMLVVLLVFTGWAIAFYGLASMVPPLMLFLGTLIVLYGHKSHKPRENFEAWRKVWPKNLLIPGLYESAVVKFEHRRIIQTSLCLLYSSALMALLSTGSYINYILAFISLLISIRSCDNIDLMVLLSYLVIIGLKALDVQEYHLKKLDITRTTTWWIDNIGNLLPLFKLVPMALVCYESLRSKKPHLLWPLMIGTSYCIGLESTFWAIFQWLSCLRVALHFKTMRTAVILSSAVVFGFLIAGVSVLQTESIIRGPKIEKIEQPLLWTDFDDLCVSRDVWEQRPEQQFLCAKWIGSPVDWSGLVAGVYLKPSKTFFMIHDTFHTIFNPLKHGYSSWWLECQLKLNIPQGRNLIGSRRFQTIFATVTNTNLCLNVQRGDEVQFEGFIRDFGEATTHVYIQKLTKRQ